MPFWSMLVDVVRAAVFASAHVMGGSLGAGIIAVSVVVRIALLPITWRAALRMREHQVAVKRLAPEIARLRKRFAKDPRRLMEETAALHQRHGVPQMPPGFFTGLVQAPVGMAMYQAIRGTASAGAKFLWIGDLTRPDVALAVGVAATTFVIARFGVSESPRSAAAISTLITLTIAWRLSASIGLYWMASGAISLGESLAIRRRSGMLTTQR